MNTMITTAVHGTELHALLTIGAIVAVVTIVAGVAYIREALGGERP